MDTLFLTVLTSDVLKMHDKIENDEFYKHFLSSEARTDLQPHLTVSEQIKKLSEGIEQLGIELHDQIYLKHKDLLSQASCTHNLEKDLSEIQNHVVSLSSGAEKIKNQIHEPYNKLESHTIILTRVHSACHILRHVVLFQNLMKQLQKTSDFIKQAKLLKEITELSQDETLDGIEVIAAEIRSILSRKEKVILHAKNGFIQGLASDNNKQVSNAIQILLNLGCLQSAVSEIISDMLDKVTENVKAALNVTDAVLSTPKGKTGPGSANLTTSFIPKEKLWSSMEHFFLDELFSLCKQVHVVQIILLDLVENDENKQLESKFWMDATSNINSEMRKTSPAFQTIFEENYPRLLKLYSDLTAKLNNKHFVFKQSMVAAWENTYLSKSLSRLLDPVNDMFSEEIPPNHDQIESLIKTMSNELNVALVDENLSNTIAKNVVKCVQSFALKSENLIAVGPETNHTIGATNPSQKQNVQLANMVHHFKNQMENMISNMSQILPDSSLELIKDSLKNTDRVVSAILSPLVVSINNAIETIIVTIHSEDWNKIQYPANKTSINCSAYMRELMEYIARAYKVHLAPFQNIEALSSCCAQIAVRCIELFVRHTSLVRPVSSGGRLRLQADYISLENALCTLCPHLPSLGRPYRLLKSMATLIALDPNEIVKSQLAGSSVPQSTVVMLLFSHAGPQLSSPHQTAGWTIAKMSAWLDEHTEERDRLELISGAVQRYLTVVRQNNVTNYDHVYLLITDLLKQQ